MFIWLVACLRHETHRHSLRLAGRKTNILTPPSSSPPADSRLPPARTDLSLAERGKIGGGTSSSSSSSSTASGEDELTSSLRQRDVRRYRKLPARTPRSPNGSPTHSQPPPSTEVRLPDAQSAAPQHRGEALRRTVSRPPAPR